MAKRAADYAVDVVAFVESDEVDVVHEIYGRGHDRYCDYRPYIREDGFIWCDTCGITIGSIPTWAIHEDHKEKDHHATR